MKLKSIVAIAFVSIMFSCSKQSSQHIEDEKQLPSILSYLKALTKPTDGEFSISSSAPMNSNSQELLFQGVFVDKNRKAKNIGVVSFNNASFAPDVNNQYGNGTTLGKNIYGTTVSFRIEGNTTASAIFKVVPVNDSLYVPKEVIFNKLVLDNEVEKNTVGVGKTFTYEIDVNNTNGIIVVVEYSPESYSNESIKSSYPNYVRNGKAVADNGKVVLDDSYFNGIPKNASVTITIARANYKFNETPDSETYLLYAYNFKYFNFKYQ
jgi:hypothetical protein